MDDIPTLMSHVHIQVTPMIYIASHATLGELEAEQDDPSFDLESMASPQLVSVAMKMTSDWVDLMKASLFDEVMSDGEYDEELTWKTAGWNEVDGRDGRRSNQVWDLMDGEEIVGKLVIQRVPVSEI